jgi:hypothetical protein
MARSERAADGDVHAVRCSRGKESSGSGRIFFKFGSLDV